MTLTADPLSRALDEAVAGRTRALHDLLVRGSKLPGTRMNEDLAEAFALACRARGAKADALALAMARMSADQAPGATALEFLPVVGLRAIAARGTADGKARATALSELHAHADDLRFRVRDAVVAGLVRLGAAGGDALVGDVASWMDGYFHAAAVLRALGEDGWLNAIQEAGPVVERLDEAFLLVQGAPRAAARWPGHKALIETLGTVPGAVAARFGVPVFDMLVRWAAAKDPALREVVEKVLTLRRLEGRFRPDLQRVRDALIGSRPAPRNPDHDFGPSRDRSGSRRRNRR